MTNIVRYEEYAVGQLVECKFEVRKDGKVEFVWWAGVVVQVS